MASSIESVPSDFQESLREAGIDNLLEFLSRKADSELRLCPNEQRGEPELDTAQKLTLLRSKLEHSPGSFLFQFGKYLHPSHLDCFMTIRHQNYEVDLYLTQMSAASSDARKLQVKNRRYEALQKLVDTSDYFTEEEMQRRNPILFHQLIGRYHSKEEREAFLFTSSRSTSARSADPACRPTPLTDMLIAHMSRGEGICSDRRIDQQMQLQEEKQAQQDYSNLKPSQDANMNEIESDEDEDEGNEDETTEEGEAIPEIDDAEKDLLKEEFFTTMYRHFLEGKDEDFPYDTVDNNTEYDIGETLDQDEEEKYFDAEEEGVEGQHDGLPEVVDPALNSPPVQLTHSESEDELDSYMREIEAQVTLQNRCIS